MTAKQELGRKARETREQLHREVDALPALQVSRARIVVPEEPEDSGSRVAELPEAWATFEDGTPQPDWVALLDEARSGLRWDDEISPAEEAAVAEGRADIAAGRTASLDDVMRDLD